MRKKKICICAAQVPFVKGGAELLVASLYQQLIHRDFEVEIIQLPYKWYPKDQLLSNILSWRMLDLAESNGEKIDLVIPTKFPSYVIQHHNKVTWLIHQFRQIYDQYGTEYSDFQDNSPEDIQVKNQIIEIDNKTLKESKEIFTIAQNVTNRLQRFNKIESKVLYHPPKHVGQYFCDDYGDYILSVGRLESVKRIELLIKSLPHCNKKVKALIAGKGPNIQTLKDLVYQLGVEDQVEFLGFVNDQELLKLYANASAVFFAPFDEDYGYITLEAFLSKKPIVTCNDSGGVLEFVVDGENGFICEKDPREIGQRLQELWDDRVKCEKMGNRGYQKVKDISWDYVIDRLTETIR